MEPIEDDGKKRSQESGHDRGREAPNSDSQSINESYSEGFIKGISDDKSTPGYDSAIPNITDVFDFPKDFDE